MKKEKKESKAKEQLVAFGKDVAENYNKAIDNEGTNKKILVIGGIVLCILLVGWWFFSDTKQAEHEQAKMDNTSQGISYEDAMAEDGEINVSEFTNHDDKLIGMWGPSDFDLEEYKDESYDAYMFTKDGYVSKRMAEQGQVMGEYGSWQTDNQGNVYITWKDSEGEEFYSETMTYEVEESEQDGKILILDDNDYYPIDEEIIFS